MTHTYVLMELPPEVHALIEKRLREAGYAHAINSEGELDMRGIALTKEPGPNRVPELHCATCQCNKLHSTPPIPGNPMSKSWHDDSAQLAAAAQRHAEARAEADKVLKDVFTERPKS